MPEIEVSVGERRLAETIVRHVRFLASDLSPEGKTALAAMLVRSFEAEPKELKRRASDGG